MIKNTKRAALLLTICLMAWISCNKKQVKKNEEINQERAISFPVFELTGKTKNDFLVFIKKNSNFIIQYKDVRDTVSDLKTETIWVNNVSETIYQSENTIIVNDPSSLYIRFNQNGLSYYLHLLDDARSIFRFE